MDLLATTHVEKKGIYLWSNQLVFGSGTDIIQSERPINVRLPRAGTNAGMFDGEEEDEEDMKKKKRKSLVAEMLGHTKLPHISVNGGGNSSGEEEESDDEGDGVIKEDVSTSEDFSSDDDDGSDKGDDQARYTAAAAVEGGIDVKTAVYAEKDDAGAPVPLVPELVTLSLLPHTRWQQLVHLDTIKARNKPVEPPKKPEAAPFFLPTVLGANAGRDPLFDIFSGNNDEDEAGKGSSSRVVLGLDDSSFGGGGDDGSNTTLIHLLKSCSQAGDWTSTIAYIRSLSPVKLDAELRELDVLGDDETTEQQLELMLRFLDEETAANRNFELMQAVLRVVITVHGDVISASSDDSVLKKRAEGVKRRVKAAWKRLDYLLQDTRCMVGVLSNLQA
jgi:U3 small nucleolar RNA-associated protein 21